MYTSKVLIAIVICGLVQTSFGDEAPPTPPTLHDLIEKTRNAAHDLFTTFSQVVGLPGRDQLYNDLQNITGKMQNTIQKVYEDLKQNTGNISGLSAVMDKLNEVAAHLKEKAPDTTQLQENFQKAVDTLVEQSTKVSDELKNQDGELQKKVRGILESAVSSARNITTDLQDKLDNMITKLQTTEKP